MPAGTCSDRSECTQRCSLRRARGSIPTNVTNIGNVIMGICGNYIRKKKGLKIVTGGKIVA